MNFQLTTAERLGATVVTVAGELDVSTAPALADALDGLDPDGRVAVDLTAIEFVDSTGVRTIANAAKRSDAFAIVCPSSNRAVTRVLELTGFADALTVVGSIDDLDLA